MDLSERYYIAILLTVTGAVFVWSATGPTDRFTWILEVLPAVAALLVLSATRARFPLTRVVYLLIAIHAVILMVGGHYTYAHVPLFDSIRDTFGLSRNHYDRVGHFAQGFVPAMVTREILLRRTPLERGGWLFVLITAVCLAISALYELLEWQVSIWTGSAGDAFLGTQGDVFDTQKDMAMCFVGAIIAQLALGRVHDRSLSELAARGRGGRPDRISEGKPAAAS